DPLLQSAILGQCPPSPPTFAHKEDLRTLTATGRRAARLEHRLTRANASLAELDAAVALAVEHDCAAVTVTPWLVKAARRALGRDRMRLGTIVGYGSGSQILAVKAFEASKALEQGQLAIDGNDLVAELGVPPGPQIGELLRRLLEAVLDDPSENTRERLLALARGWQSEPGASEHRQDGDSDPPEGADDGPAATIGDPGAVPT
ncbi:MAG TPA: hypothetical protein VFQ46_03085, partial [Candidatus Limnocylindria bacterium]|nr:hypothetical protein [Candidatus Limnocylindria bacterium]